jgi:cytoskeletal protein CcmA (bactofilin family)
MGFFKEFKEDLSQAVNELLPEDDQDQQDDGAEEQMINTLDSQETVDDTSSDSEKLKEWLEDFTQDETITEGFETEDELLSTETEDEWTDTEDRNTMNETDFDETAKDQITDELYTSDRKEEEGEAMDDNVDLELLEAMNSDDEAEKVVEVKEKTVPKVRTTSVSVDDEITVISKGTTITGSISSDGSLDIMGTITGDIECLGKLSISGKITGNSSAAEVYVNTERLEGCITSEGCVKVGLGTVIIGDIIATSGVIAGAVKGEIDINGPIVVDSTAIIKGNIKAKSVQINNGAVIEGFCSLSYSSVDVDNIFE